MRLLLWIWWTFLLAGLTSQRQTHKSVTRCRTRDPRCECVPAAILYYYSMQNNQGGAKTVFTLLHGLIKLFLDTLASVLFLCRAPIEENEKAFKPLSWIHSTEVGCWNRPRISSLWFDSIALPQNSSPAFPSDHRTPTAVNGSDYVHNSKGK